MKMVEQRQLARMVVNGEIEGTVAWKYGDETQKEAHKGW